MKVSIIGAAGGLGSSTAFNIATQGLADEMVLLDIRQNVLENHVLDIKDALVACNRSVVIRAGSYEDMVGSDVVIMVAGGSIIVKVSSPQATAADRAMHSRQQLVAENLIIVKDVAQAVGRFCPDAILITGANPVEALSYAAYLLSTTRDRKKFIGYSLNDTIRFRLWVAEALGIEPSRVEATVIGEHGDSQVPLFSSVRVDNKPVSLSQQVKEKLQKKPAERVRQLLSLKAGRTSGWVSGVGLARLVRAIRDDTQEPTVCSAILAGEYGYQGFSMSVPVILGQNGIQKILEWKLSRDEQEQLERSAGVLKAAAHFVEESLGVNPNKK